jgi:hypothetical protein
VSLLGENTYLATKYSEFVKRSCTNIYSRAFVKAGERQAARAVARPLSIVPTSAGSQCGAMPACAVPWNPCLGSSAGPRAAGSHEPWPAAVIMSSRICCAQSKSHRRLVMCCALRVLARVHPRHGRDGQRERGSPLLCRSLHPFAEAPSAGTIV